MLVCPLFQGCWNGQPGTRPSCPSGRMAIMHLLSNGFSKRLDQGIFQSTLLPPKNHNTFEFGEWYLKVFMITFYLDISSATFLKAPLWLKHNIQKTIVIGCVK